jgi:hypothetical protein
MAAKRKRRAAAACSIHGARCKRKSRHKGVLTGKCPTCGHYGDDCHGSKRNPAAAKFGKWYKHPKGGMVRVRNAGGKIVVDIKK